MDTRGFHESSWLELHSIPSWLSPGGNRSSRAAEECHRDAAGWLSGHGHRDGQRHGTDLPPAPWCWRNDTSEYRETPASTDAAGRFEMVLPEDRYNFCVRAKDRVCIAITDRECLAGQKLELPPFKLINGGFITGQVVNASTGQPIAVTDRGEPIVIGLLGPSQPLGKAVSPLRLANVDSAGRYSMRAAPGENFPYFVNFHGDRMAWNTTKQPAVVVKEGRDDRVQHACHTKYTSRAKSLKAARKLVDSLSTKPSERTTQILLEFRKLESHG